VRDTKVVVRTKGTVGDLEKLAEARKAAGGRRNFWDWHRLWFYLFCVKGTWNLEDIRNDDFHVKPATLEGFLKEHPQY